jgi:hypothetical protein
MGIKMIVKKAFRPGGSGSPLLQSGSPFEAPGESLARTYRAMGWAEDAPPPAPAPAPFAPPAYTRRVMKAEEPEADKEVPVKTTRRYQRRDMTAKE